MDEILLFCYGSMKKGYKHHGMLKDAKFVMEIETEANYLLYDTGPYPGMIEVNDGEGRNIEGEIYSMHCNDFKILDIKIPGSFKTKNVKIIPPMHDMEIISHIYNQSVLHFLDCGKSWPRY